MGKIVLTDLVKKFGEFAAVDHADLDVREGEFLVLLGASGCGKTTLLRCIAGLEKPDNGEIHLDGRCLFSAVRRVDVPPRFRGVGLVFQNYALFPHLTVAGNIAFGLRVRRLPRSEIERRVDEVIELAGLRGLEGRYPRQLSGGQQQRVAVARMLASRPSVLLFDEPFSNLDGPLRARLRADVRRLHRRLETTTIFVTHDQSEAMVLADRIVVMADGSFQQIGSPQEIYLHPARVAVAGFTGALATNLLAGSIRRIGSEISFVPQVDPQRALPLPDPPPLQHGQPVILNVRPEDAELELYPFPGELRLTVHALLPSGADCLVYLRLPDGRSELLVRDRAPARELEPGREVGLRLKRGNLFDAHTEYRLGSFGERPAG